MSTAPTRNADPRKKYVQPEIKDHDQKPPGLETDMETRPDHGESSYQGSGKLTGRGALITGADSGIGRAVAIAYAREGADVAISYLGKEEEDAKETARWVEAFGRKALLLPGDITDAAFCKSLVETTYSEFGRLDLLVNNAAFQLTHDDFSEFTPEEIQHTFATNIFAMFYLCQAAFVRMKPGSAIINTSSVQGYQPSPELLAYATTKGAIITFTKGLSKAAMEKGIRVNTVAPGPIWTPLIPSTLGMKEAKSFGDQTPVGRAGQPAELAGAYVLLASDDSSYTTGMVYGVTGGMLLA